MSKTALTYDDIQLIPSYSEIVSRKDISLETKLSKSSGKNGIRFEKKVRRLLLKKRYKTGKHSKIIYSKFERLNI